MGIVEQFRNQMIKARDLLILTEANKVFHLDPIEKFDNSVSLICKGNIEINLIEKNNELLLFNLSIIKKRKLDSVLNLISIYTELLVKIKE